MVSGKTTPKKFVSASTSSPMTPPRTSNNINENPSPPSVLRADLPHASDILAIVQAPENLQKLKDLQCTSIDEFHKLAHDDYNDLWKLDQVSGNYVLDKFEYNNQFEPFDDLILEDVPIDQLPDFSKIPVYGAAPSNEAASLPQTLQTECSKETVVVSMDQLDLVNLFMDAKQWSHCFYDNVIKAEILDYILDGESNYDGALLLVSAEYNFPSPLVETRKCYFLRACYEMLDCESWLVVDFSLDPIFPNLSTNYIKKPSGLMIEAGEREGYSKVTWIEHVEVDTSMVHDLFKPVVTSGYGFGAARWVASLTRHLARVSSYSDNVGDLIKEGRQSLLRLAERMTRKFILGISDSSENTWDSIPLPLSEDILVRTKYNTDDPGSPSGVIVTIATTIWLQTQSGKVSNFLQDASNRHKWDILSLNRPSQALVSVSTDTDPRGCVSIIPVQPSMPFVFNLQEVRVGTTGTYIVYAPVDRYSLYSVLQGRDSSDVDILSSGFVVMPDRAPIKGENTGGTLLTISFQMIADIEHATLADHLPDKSVLTFHRILTETVSLIKAAMEEGGKIDDAVG